MNLINIPGELYKQIYLLLIASLSLFFSLQAVFISNSGNSVIYRKDNSLIFAVIVFLVLSIFLGLRPFGIWFGDTNYYLYIYNNVIYDYNSIDWTNEWVWNNFSVLCKKLGFSDSSYLLSIETIYIGFMLLTCHKVIRNNIGIAFLFCISALSFYAYAVNGLRNGVACSITMYAVALLCSSKYEKVIAFFLIVLAFGIHHSVAIPCLCAIISTFLIKEPKYALTFWGVSIFLSLFFGNAFNDLFASLELDERASYFEDVAGKESAALFSSTGFRFDFLLYSAIPVALVFYLTIKRSFRDTTYNIIANTYILSNAFWIIVIRATYSNRFAYLSWFLYPIVLAYPILKMNISKKQDLIISISLILHTLFTIILLTLR